MDHVGRVRRAHEVLMRRPRSVTLVLTGILFVAFGLRIWSITHGLPFVFNVDEELHFVPVAVNMFRGSFNPHYFENPPLLTYVFHFVFRLRFTEGFPFGSGDLRTSFRDDPEPAYVTARVLVALLGTAAVGLVYGVGRRYFDARVGLVAAAIMSAAFLPVFYSHFALNDVVTMVPVALALIAVLRIWEYGRLLEWALAGAAVGCATAVKYTAGAMLAVVVVAGLCRLLTRDDDRKDDAATLLGHGLVGLAAFGVVFVLLNPFSLLEFSEFRRQVMFQSSQASGAKLGQEDMPGWLYYLRTVSWGLGWLPALAAVAGGVLVARACMVRGLLLLTFPVVLFFSSAARAVTSRAGSSPSTRRYACLRHTPRSGRTGRRATPTPAPRGGHHPVRAHAGRAGARGSDPQRNGAGT